MNTKTECSGSECKNCGESKKHLNGVGIMWTCPNCNQTVPGGLDIKEDEKIVAQNLIVEKVFRDRLETFERTIEFFKKEIEEHNKNLKWYQHEWYLNSNFANMYSIMSQGSIFDLHRTIYGWSTTKMVKGYHAIIKPTLEELRPYKYIECPGCHYRHYIKG